MKKLNRFTSAILCSALIICSAANSLSISSSADDWRIPTPESAVSWGDKTLDYTYTPDVSDKTMKAINKAKKFYGYVDEYSIKKCEIAEKIANGILKNYTTKDDGSIEYIVRIETGISETFEFKALPDKTNLDEIIADTLLKDVCTFGPNINIKATNSAYTKVSFPLKDEWIIRYTLNGKEPTDKSPIYKGGTFKVTGASTIKIRIYQDGYRAKTFSYFVDVNGTQKTTADNYKDNYFYKQLTAEQKKYYEACFIANRYGIKCDYPKLSDYDRYRAMYAYEADVYHTWVERYRVSGDAKIKAAAAKVYEIVNKALEYKTDYERIKVLHDELCRFANYRYNDLCDGSAETLFEEGTGVCDCFSKAFATLCTMSGIDCIRIVGDVTSSDRSHAWNMVKLDGKWYYVDTTWDDVSSYKQIRRYNSAENKWEVTREYTFKYTYFLKSENDMGKSSNNPDHFPDRSDLEKYGLKYPTASATSYKA